MTDDICVGSLNPVKIRAAQQGFSRAFGRSFAARGLDVESGVAEQPMTDAETRQGATQRARQVRAQDPSCAFAVGIEGGLTTIEDQFFTAAWIVIIDAQGFVAQARSATFALPPRIQTLLRAGVELGVANDLVFQEQNSKHAGGAVGSLTRGVISREALYEQAMVLALIPMQNQELFRE